MKILVLGATRGIGKEVVRAALAAGHQVRAFARGADAIEPQEGLEPWTGDATSPEDLAPALEGVDAVVSALGITESVMMPWREVTLFSDSTAALIPLMESNGPDRLIVVTGIGTGTSKSALSSIERLGHWALLSKPYEDKDRQEALVRASSLRWTLVRPTILRNGPATGRYKVLTDPADWRMGLIRRADVADFVIKALSDDTTVGADPVITV
jgi:uncharacterized protein YbjT (DUF2867 family)